MAPPAITVTMAERSLEPIEMLPFATITVVFRVLKALIEKGMIC